MTDQKTIPCAFCKGTGRHPHFTESTCPVCKGRGKNQVVGKYMTCRECRGSGQKRGTTLTCYTCSGLGVVPDTREEIKKAKAEIKKARKEMDEERREFGKADQSLAGKKQTEKKVNKKETEETVNESEGPTGKIFCQCCAKKVGRDSAVKVCLDCLRKIKKA